MITAPGVGSGLDVQSIVSQLMALERRPLEALARRQDQYEAQLSAYGQLKSALSSFQDAMDELGATDAFKIYAATSADESALEVFASSSASLGTYNVRVERLAANHKMASAELADTTTFGGTAGDSLTIQVGSVATNSIAVDLGTTMSMEDIRDQINDAADNPGVTATIINGNNGNQKLILTADETGSSSAISLSYGGSIDASTFGMHTLNDIGGDLSLLDSKISVDGYSITRSTNTLTDVIQGVTLDLRSARPGVDIQVTVERDISAVEASVQGFADAYNELRSSIRSLREGQLEADITLLSIERGLLGILNTPTAAGTFSHLTQIGVSIQKDGSMSVNSSRLGEALNTDYGAVAELFAKADSGYAVRLGSRIGMWLEDGGLIDSRTHGLDSRIEDLEDRQSAMDRRLAQVEARYLKQFSSLDSLMSQLQGTSNFLTSQLASLPGAGQ